LPLFSVWLKEAAFVIIEGENMSNRDPRQRFDYQNWLNGQVAERAKASLTARDAAFAENNAGVTRAALTQYLNVCAAALGHSPSPTEIDGGAFIEQRFGSWDNAMTAAGLPRPKTTPKLNNTLRYRMEKEKLLPLFLFERKEKKWQRQTEKDLRRGQRMHERAVKRRAEREAAEAKKAAAEKDTNPCQAETV
jgi:hypothetical protein